MIELDRIDKKSAPQKRGALHSLWKGHSCSLLVLLAGLRFGRGIIHDADRRILLFDERVDLVEVLAREEESLFRVAVPMCRRTMSACPRSSHTIALMSSQGKNS